MPPPAEALSVGLVDMLVPKDALLPAAEQAMGQLLASPDAGRIETKKFQRSEFSRRWEAHASVEADTQYSLMESPSVVQALEAYMKRLSGKKKSKL